MGRYETTMASTVCVVIIIKSNNFSFEAEKKRTEV
jgi:hypothetical protein